MKNLTTSIALATLLTVPLHAKTEKFDLAAESELTVPVPAGELRVEFLHALPNADYRVRFDLLADLEPKLSPPNVAMAAGGPCQGIVAATTALRDNTTSEADVPAAEAILKAALDADAKIVPPAPRCDDQTRAVAEGVLARTRLTPRVEELARGERLEVTVERLENGEVKKTWRRVYRAPALGEFFSTYGFTFSRNDDELFFTEAVPGETGKFQIKKKAGREESDFTPALFYSWMPAKSKARLFSGGFTAGLGFDNDQPAVFVGVIGTMRHNISLVGGAAIRRVARLHGRYSEDANGNLPIVGTELSEDQLTERTYKPTAFLGVAFRFDRSPFGAATDETNQEDGETTDEGDGPDATEDPQEEGTR